MTTEEHWRQRGCNGSDDDEDENDEKCGRIERTENMESNKEIKKSSTVTVAISKRPVFRNQLSFSPDFTKLLLTKSIHHLISFLYYNFFRSILFSFLFSHSI